MTPNDFFQIVLGQCHSSFLRCQIPPLLCTCAASLYLGSGRGHEKRAILFMTWSITSMWMQIQGVFWSQRVAKPCVANSVQSQPGGLPSCSPFLPITPTPRSRGPKVPTILQASMGELAHWEKIFGPFEQAGKFGYRMCLCLKCSAFYGDVKNAWKTKDSMPPSWGPPRWQG